MSEEMLCAEVDVRRRLEAARNRILEVFAYVDSHEWGVAIRAANKATYELSEAIFGLDLILLCADKANGRGVGDG